MAKAQNKTKYSPEEIDSMLSEITAEVVDFLRKDEAELSKAVKDDAPDEQSEGSSGPTDAESGPTDAPPMDAPGDDGSAPADAPVSPEQSEASAAPDGSPTHEAGEIEPAPTVEQLQSEYMKLDSEALKMHYLACKSAIMAAMGQQSAPPAGPEASAPAGAPPGAPPAASAPPAMKAEKRTGPTKEENDEWEGMKTQALLDAKRSSPPAKKGEMGAGKKIELTADANGGQITIGSKLGKSESDVKIAVLEDKLAQNDAALTELLTFLAKPLRKSVKGVSELKFLAKEDDAPKVDVKPLTKAEAVSVLREKAKTATLSKNDRDLITSFTFGNVDISKIEHLLK